MQTSNFCGRFTSDGQSKIINFGTEIDWIEAWNYTKIATTQTDTVPVKWYWQKGFPDGDAFMYGKSDATTAASLVVLDAGSGFIPLNTSLIEGGPVLSTITGISNDAVPLVTNTGANGLSAGDTVRLTSIIDGRQISGMDFTVGLNTLSDTTFSLDYMPAIGAATTGSFQKILVDSKFYPRKRSITAVSLGAQTEVATSVTHGFAVGMVVRFVIPAAFGMTELDSLTGTIVAVDTTTNTFTVDIDSSSFNVFAFPTDAEFPFSKAEVIPVGEAAIGSNAANLDDVTYNASIMGMEFVGGAFGPAGEDGDVIYWKAGNCFSVDNQ